MTGPDLGFEKITATARAKRGTSVIKLAGYGSSVCKNDEMMPSWTRVVASGDGDKWMDSRS